MYKNSKNISVFPNVKSIADKVFNGIYININKTFIVQSILIKLIILVKKKYTHS